MKAGEFPGRQNTGRSGEQKPRHKVKYHFHRVVEVTGTKRVPSMYGEHISKLAPIIIKLSSRSKGRGATSCSTFSEYLAMLLERRLGRNAYHWSDTSPTGYDTRLPQKIFQGVGRKRVNQSLLTFHKNTQLKLIYADNS